MVKNLEIQNMFRLLEEYFKYLQFKKKLQKLNNI